MSPLFFSPYVPPRFDHLPDAVISGQLWHGTLSRCGPGVRGTGWPETPMVRAQTLPFLVGAHPLVAVLQTAAWVWGYEWVNTLPAAFSTVNAKRFLHQVPPRCRVYEFNILDHHMYQMGDVLVTSPERTVYDFLYLADTDINDELTSAMSYLTRKIEMCDEELVRVFHGRNRPYRKRALQRLTRLRG